MYIFGLKIKLIYYIIKVFQRRSHRDTKLKKIAKDFLRLLVKL